jgi:hypothetical protein
MTKIAPERVIEVHLQNLSEGGTMQTLADKLGMKKGTVSSRLNVLRAKLRSKGFSDEAVNHALPLYGYRKGPRTDQAKVIDSLVAKASAFVRQELEKEQEESIESAQPTQSTETV